MSYATLRPALSHAQTHPDSRCLFLTATHESARMAFDLAQRWQREFGFNVEHTNRLVRFPNGATLRFVACASEKDTRPLSGLWINWFDYEALASWPSPELLAHLKSRLRP